MNNLKEEDYKEPCCPLDTSQWQEKTSGGKVDIHRVQGKLDELFYHKDYDGAKRLLNYWLEEARALNDRQAEFQLENELMGLTRKLGQGEEAIKHAENALRLIRHLQIEDNIGAATSYINAGTVYKAFGKAKEALPLFEKAKLIYENTLQPDDPRLGGLYNNMALALADLNRFAEAIKLYDKALEIMSKAEGGQADAAITWLNLANCVEKEKDLEEALPQIEEAVENAWNCLNSKELKRDGYYSFVCEKCIPGFEYYGYLDYANQLKSRT